VLESPTRLSETRSTGTVHTSAKARITSVVIQIRIRDPDRHQNLTICSLAHCRPSLKISRKSIYKFLRKVANRQTNNDDYIYISSLAEVKRRKTLHHGRSDKTKKVESLHAHLTGSKITLSDRR